MKKNNSNTSVPEQQSFSGLGSCCYICEKKDLDLDTMTPKEGKKFYKIDVSKSTTFEIPLEQGNRKAFSVPNAFDGLLEKERVRAELRIKDIEQEALRYKCCVFVTDSHGNCQVIGSFVADEVEVTDHGDTCDVSITGHPISAPTNKRIVPRLRRSRLHIKVMKKLYRWSSRDEDWPLSPCDRRRLFYHSDNVPTSRRVSHNINQKMKLFKRGKQAFNRTEN